VSADPPDLMERADRNVAMILDQMSGFCLATPKVGEGVTALVGLWRANVGMGIANLLDEDASVVALLHVAYWAGRNAERDGLPYPATEGYRP
jgi:hypothetical protein